MNGNTLKNYINSDEPLSNEAVECILSCKDENIFIDFKENFENDDKHWLDITKDIMAFSNTSGGYIVFGIRDSDFSQVGLPIEITEILRNTNLIMQKANRNVAPPFANLRSVQIKKDNKSLVILYVPPSKGKTHIVSKEGFFQHPSGSKKTVLYPGLIFIRRSATNAILSPEDFEFILNMRIEEYKDILLNRIQKVVDAPPSHNVLIFDPTNPVEEGDKYVISDSSDAKPVKGISFTVSPQTDVEEVVSWIALRGKDPQFQPRESRLWQIYSKRTSLTLTQKQKM